MSQRTEQNISKDGLDDRHTRLQHAQRTGQWLTYPPAVLDEYPTFLAAFDAKRNRRKLMRSRQEIENDVK